jgi:hypothetical protein
MTYKIDELGALGGSYGGNGPSSAQLPDFKQPASTGGSTSPVSAADANSWYAAMARAWGSALDKQAGKLSDLSDQISNAGQDQPSVLTVLTAESMRMQFLSNNASTSMNAVGQALETLGRKQ